MSVTILYKEQPPFPVMATPDGDDLWLTLDDLRSATGWEIRPEGVCREGQCVPRHEDLPGLLGVLVRVPVRPARVAGALRRAEGPELRRPCRRAGQRRRRKCRAVDSSRQANLSLPD